MEEKSPRYLDSIALAHFLCSEHVEAVEAQRRALELLGDQPGELRSELERKLRKYESALDASAGGARPGAGAEEEPRRGQETRPEHEARPRARARHSESVDEATDEPSAPA